MGVSAIIPTIGRPELERAVRSVNAQTVPVTPIVVLDRPTLKREISDRLAGLPHELIVTQGAVGGGAARNLGVAHARSDVVAFLDDDDEWLPEKTEKQLALLESAPASVVTCRATLVGSSERVVPEVLFSGEETLSSYLLERSTIRLRRHFMQSSTLLMGRETAVAVPWESELRRHQDWALLIDLDCRGHRIVSNPMSLVRVYQGSAASISRSKDWEASESWLRTYATDASERAQADFLCSVVARTAFRARRPTTALRFIAQAIPMRPHAAALVVALSGMRG